MSSVNLSTLNFDSLQGSVMKKKNEIDFKYFGIR